MNSKVIKYFHVAVLICSVTFLVREGVVVHPYPAEIAPFINSTLNSNATARAPSCEVNAGTKYVGNGVNVTSFMIGEDHVGKVWQAPDAVTEEPLSGFAVVQVCLDRDGEVIDAWVIRIDVRYRNESERHQLYQADSVRPESYPPEVEPYVEWLLSVVEETSFVLAYEEALENENVTNVAYRFTAP